MDSNFDIDEENQIMSYKGVHQEGHNQQRESQWMSRNTVLRVARNFDQEVTAKMEETLYELGYAFEKHKQDSHASYAEVKRNLDSLTSRSEFREASLSDHQELHLHLLVYSAQN